MTEINHRQLEAVIRETAPADGASIWLIHGEQILVERAADALIEHLLEGCARDLCSAGLDGLVENIPDLLEQMNTFGLLSGRKVMVFKDARLFENRGSAGSLIQQIEQALRNEQTAKAGRLLSAWCKRSGQNLSDIQSGANPLHDDLKALREALSPEILNQVIGVALMHAASESEDHSDMLRQSIEKGFPDGHCLIITVYSKAPKNARIYKTIEKHGVVIDCSVPAGERRADKLARETVLRETWEALLRTAGKTAERGVFEAVSQLTGFDLAAFCQGGEKLVDYSGDRTQIVLNDVRSVLRRTRSDPIFELTNAVTDRNSSQAFFYLKSIQADYHPLQIVAALANQVRKLLLARCFIDSPGGRSFHVGIAYPQFQEQVMPAILAYDSHVQEIVACWQEPGAEPAPAISPDLRLAPQPQNAYPVFQTLNKAHRYTQTELAEALERINRADLMLKSTGQNAMLILTQTIQAICRSTT